MLKIPMQMWNAVGGAIFNICLSPISNYVSNFVSNFRLKKNLRFATTRAEQLDHHYFQDDVAVNEKSIYLSFLL